MYTIRTHYKQPMHLILQVLDAPGWPLQSNHTILPEAKWGTQHRAQRWLNPKLPRHYMQPSTSSTLHAVMTKPAANTDAVRAGFAKAGIPDEVTTKVLKQYPPYLRWDPNTKLRPALQLWLKQLGSQQLSARLNKHPQLLMRIPEECTDVYLWLSAKGLDAERIQQKLPKVMGRKLRDVQSKVRAVQQGLHLTDEQLPAFFRRHVAVLAYTSDRVAQTLQTVAELLAVPMASAEMHEAVMVCNGRLFNYNPAVLHHLVTFFCKEFKGGQRAAKNALKSGVYWISACHMMERAKELKTMLNWTTDELNKAVNVHPSLLIRNPATVAKNIQKLRAHSFSSAQALEIYASFPALAGYNWSSPSNVEKLEFLTFVLQLSKVEIVAKPQLLSTSFEDRLGPRSQFIYHSKGVTPEVPFGLAYFSSYAQYSDARFSAKFNRLSASPPLIYDEDFKQHWRQRWAFLRHEMGLSIAAIAANRALLYTSLPNTLAPRWHLLSLFEATHAFKATDHLTALATLSDEHFAQHFSASSVDLVNNKTS